LTRTVTVSPVGRPSTRTPIEGADFYEAVDRPDLAASYRTRNAVHLALGLGGLVVAMGGDAYVLSGMNFGACHDLPLLTPAYQACAARADDERASKAAIGLGIAAVGSVAFFVGAFLDPHPVDAPTRRRLADEHNRKLGVTPLVGPGGGGVQIDGRF